MANGFDSFITLLEWFVWVTVGAPQSFMLITTTKGGAIFSHIITVKSSFEVMRVRVFVVLYRQADKNYASNLNDKLYSVPKIEHIEYPAYLLVRLCLGTRGDSHPIAGKLPDMTQI